MLIDNYLGLYSLVAVSLFMSLMFPTIYGIALGNLSEEESKIGSAGLVMAIVGGALMPKLQGMIIDIGGYSTKPNGHEVSLEEEIKRTIPYIEAIIRRFPNVNLSIDTFRGKVASLALQAGAGMINDISAWNIDDEMINIVSKYKVPYVLMHMRGKPKTMQKQEESHSYNCIRKWRLPEAEIMQLIQPFLQTQPFPSHIRYWM